jgi:hypothetical protein
VKQSIGQVMRLTSAFIFLIVTVVKVETYPGSPSELPHDAIESTVPYSAG